MSSKASALLMLSALIPIETHLEKLQECINKYVLDNSQENKDNLNSSLHATIICLMTNGKIENALRMAEDIDKLEKTQSLFKAEKN